MNTIRRAGIGSIDCWNYDLVNRDPEAFKGATQSYTNRFASDNPNVNQKSDLAGGAHGDSSAGGSKGKTAGRKNSVSKGSPTKSSPGKTRKNSTTSDAGAKG